MKVVIVVLVVVLLLFVVAVGLGVGQDRGDTDVSREGIGDWLADTFLRPVPPVPPEDLTGDCLEGAALSVASGASCSVAVSESSRFARELKLVSTAGTAHVTLDREKGLDVAEDVAPGEQLEIDLARDAATFTVTCAFGPCVLGIAQ